MDGWMDVCARRPTLITLNAGPTTTTKQNFKTTEGADLPAGPAPGQGPHRLRRHGHAAPARDRPGAASFSFSQAWRCIAMAACRTVASLIFTPPPPHPPHPHTHKTQNRSSWTTPSAPAPGCWRAASPTPRTPRATSTSPRYAIGLVCWNVVGSGWWCWRWDDGLSGLRWGFE